MKFRYSSCDAQRRVHPSCPHRAYSYNQFVFWGKRRYLSLHEIRRLWSRSVSTEVLKAHPGRRRNKFGTHLTFLEVFRKNKTLKDATDEWYYMRHGSARTQHKRWRRCQTTRPRRTQLRPGPLNHNNDNVDEIVNDDTIDTTDADEVINTDDVDHRDENTFDEEMCDYGVTPVDP